MIMLHSSWQNRVTLSGVLGVEYHELCQQYVRITASRSRPNKNSLFTRSLPSLPNAPWLEGRRTGIVPAMVKFRWSISMGPRNKFRYASFPIHKVRCLQFRVHKVRCPAPCNKSDVSTCFEGQFHECYFIFEHILVINRYSLVVFIFKVGSQYSRVLLKAAI
jgi:hypothetical protein